MTQDLVRDLCRRTASLLNMLETDATNPWYSAYPSPRNVAPKHITRADLLQRMQMGQKSGRDFLLIDLRSTDHEVWLQFVFVTIATMAFLFLFVNRNVIAKINGLWNEGRYYTWFA
jgi:hypothetical protein